MSKLTVCLWCNGTAEEQMNYYLSVFKDGEARDISHYPEGSGDMSGKVLTANLRLHDMEFCLLNAGDEFPYSEAVSIQVDCDGQEEVDYFWNRLVGDGGEESQCGWLKDKFGFSWQIIPKQLFDYFGQPDPEVRARVHETFMQMKKIDLAGLEAAVKNG